MTAENFNQGETERVSGTLDAVAAYIAKEYGLSALDAAKVTTLLWLGQECERADAIKSPELNVGLKSLTDFGGEGSKAQGMAVGLRIFVNVNEAAAMALKSIPAEILEDILLHAGIDAITIKLLLRVAGIFIANTTVVSDGLACVCMRAWRYVRKQKHIPFQAKDIMPNREYPQDGSSSLICDLTQDDGRQRLGAANWQCPYHRGENYCCLTTEMIGTMLDVLEQQGILVSQGTLESPGGKSYLFL